MAVDVREAVEMVVALYCVDPAADDDEILSGLTNAGIGDTTAVRLIQFVPIAFTRFLYRTSGVQFAENYTVLNSNGQPIAQRAIAEEPVFREAWNHCEAAAAEGVASDYFESVASRSGGYRAIHDLLARGSQLNGLMTGPPFLWE